MSDVKQLDGAAATSRPDPEVVQFARDAIDRYAQYRDHKEAMAYAGVVIYAAACGALIISQDWPPARWGAFNRFAGVIAVVVLWGLVVAYLKYQLRKRRWAALRVAGCEWVLARALPEAPVPPEHRDLDRFLNNELKPTLTDRFWDYLWPRVGAVTAVNRRLKVYPPTLVRAWTNAELFGTDALGHERIVQVVGWLLFLVSLLITLLAKAPLQSTSSVVGAS